MYLVTRNGLTRIVCWLLIISLSACTSTRSFLLNEIGPDLPIKVGDEVKIHEKYFGRSYWIDVTEITDEAIKGAFPYDASRVTTVPWDHIARIELKEADSHKTVALTAAIVVVIAILGILFVRDLECNVTANRGNNC